jgi:peptidoglycan/xylan/chitin deacetylase (PgdA/CDA1 family)
MGQLRNALTGGVLYALYCSGAYRLVPNRFRGIGALLVFHRVVPVGEKKDFNPNREMSIEATYFEAVIRLLHDLEFEIVNLSEARRRLLGAGSARRFACLTFDDGFADNYQHAFPICRRLGVPMVVYLCTGLINRESVNWGPGLEAGLETTRHARFEFAGSRNEFQCVDARGKQRAFRAIGNLFRSAPPARQHALADTLSDALGVDIRAIGDANTLTWESISDMHASGLVEFGAHSVSHPNLKTLGEDAARTEIEDSRCEISHRLGTPVEHFAYPYGGRNAAGKREFALCKQIGFKTAVTTLHGLVQPQHRDHLHSLPRITVNGHRQKLAPLSVMLSGASTAVLNHFDPLVIG